MTNFLGGLRLKVCVEPVPVSIDTSRLSQLIKDDALAVRLRREKLEKSEIVVIFSVSLEK